MKKIKTFVASIILSLSLPFTASAQPDLIYFNITQFDFKFGEEWKFSYITTPSAVYTFYDVNRKDLIDLIRNTDPYVLPSKYVNYSQNFSDFLLTYRNNDWYVDSMIATSNRIIDAHYNAEIASLEEWYNRRIAHIRAETNEDPDDCQVGQSIPIPGTCFDYYVEHINTQHDTYLLNIIIYDKRDKAHVAAAKSSSEAAHDVDHIDQLPSGLHDMPELPKSLHILLSK